MRLTLQNVFDALRTLDNDDLLNLITRVLQERKSVEYLIITRNTKTEEDVVLATADILQDTLTNLLYAVATEHSEVANAVKAIAGRLDKVEEIKNKKNERREKRRIYIDKF